MTDIVVRGLVNKQFRFGSFYFARAKRIFPALIALVLLLLAAGWFVLPTPDYQALGSQAGYALGFISNIEFAGAEGYFDSNAHEKWLLHTWSLAVEWQFYLLFPVVVWLLYKAVRGHLTALFVAFVLATLASFAWSWALSIAAPNEAFYLLPSRAWEMLAGGLVFFLAQLTRPLKLPRWSFLLGWLLIIVPFFAVNGSSQWPAPWALSSVFGTMLVMLAAREKSLFTRTAVAQWLGSRSYSIYLWHWPLAVLLFFTQSQNQWLWVGIMLVLSLILGDLSYRWIENPSRRWLGRFNKRWAGAGLVAVLLLAYVPAAVVKEHHFGGRVNPQVDQIAAETNNYNAQRDRCQASRSSGQPIGCTYGGEQLAAIVLGDSHAGAVVRAVERALGPRVETHHILDWTASACPVIADIQRSDTNRYACAAFIDYAKRAHLSLSSEAPLLIVSRFAQTIEGEMSAPNAPPAAYRSQPFAEKSDAYYNEMNAGIVEAACYFAQTRPVYMLRPIPEMPVSVPQVMARSLLFRGDVERVRLPLDQYYERQRYVVEAQNQAAEQCGVVLLDVEPTFCDDNFCWGDKNGRPLYFDDDHLSEYGADFLRPEFERMLNSEMRNER